MVTQQDIQISNSLLDTRNLTPQPVHVFIIKKGEAVPSLFQWLVCRIRVKSFRVTVSLQKRSGNILTIDLMIRIRILPNDEPWCPLC